MGKRIRRIMLCLLAVSLLNVSASVYADDEEAPEPVSESGADETAETSSKLKESVETVKADFAEVSTSTAKIRTSATNYGKKPAESLLQNQTILTSRKCSRRKFQTLNSSANLLL